MSMRIKIPKRRQPSSPESQAVISVRNPNSTLLQAPTTVTITKGIKSLDFPIVAGRIPARTTVTFSLLLDDLTTDVPVSLQP